MATDDIFSKIPDHIIHSILGFLPSIKDIVRTSCISKSWHQAWLTFPIPQFNLQDFPYRSRDGKEAKLQFIRFVDSTLHRFRRQSGEGIMKIFDLSTLNKMARHHTNRWIGEGMKIFDLSTLNKMAHHHTNRWIGMALDIKVEHLAVDIVRDNNSFLPCLIPDRIFSAHWLKSLKLVGPAIRIQSLNRVDLPLLTSLCIQDSYRINDEQLQKLLSGCPALEEIALLECDSLSKIDILNHPNLETLEFTVGEISNADHITVRAPKLKSFSYDNYECDVVVNIHNSRELKSLRISHNNMTDEWFDKFITQFPLLEDLTIDCCFALMKIRMLNPLLEKIKIKYCDNLEDVVISSKKLTLFCLFTPHSSIPNPSIRIEMDNPPNDCMTNICNVCDGWCFQLMEASWYCKLKEFLTRTSTFKSLKINMSSIYVTDGDMNEEDVQKKLPHAACNIENLRLDIRAPSSCHLHILNGLLSTCHPTTIELDVTSDNSFGKFVCEELGNIENNSRCYCKYDFKCWKHQLKEVKIEKINGIKLEKDLDWDALFDLLPTLKDGNTIYFKLMW